LEKIQAKQGELAVELEKAKGGEDESASQAKVQELQVEMERALTGVNAMRSEMIESSFLGMVGHRIEPLVRPLGWDWKIGVATIASFPAREVIIATLGTIYSLGSDENEESLNLQSQMQQAKWPDGRPVFTLATSLSIMVFFALCAQCSATLMTIRRETNSWRWPLFSFAYMTTLAYVGAWMTYQMFAWWG
jgi:ferrous iron transport protein B